MELRLFQKNPVREIFFGGTNWQITASHRLRMSELVWRPVFKERNSLAEASTHGIVVGAAYVNLTQLRDGLNWRLG
jgi:hypothetical protein